MAQTVSHGSMASTPFPLPPGLDTTNGTGGVAVDAPASPGAGATSATRQVGYNGTAGCDSKIEPPMSAECQAILDVVRRTVVDEVEQKVSEKMKNMWTNGNKMIKKAEEEGQQKNATILAELVHMRQKQEALQAEHEQLKALVAAMVQQFNVLGGYFGGLAGPKIASPTPCTLAALAATTNGTTTTTDTRADSSSASVSSTIQDSPATEFSASGFAAGSFPPLPIVPDFPFPATAGPLPPTPSVATPLSLAEALGASEAHSPSVPVSLMGSLPPAQWMFSFTLRKADGTDLGLNVSHQEDDKSLRVEGVRPEGAVEAWNRQCVGSAASEKAVQAGDRIVSVNGVVSDPAKMLEECRDRQLLKLTVVRGESAAKTTSLRADASEFVPSGSPPAPGLDAINELPEQPEQPAKDDAEKASGTEKEIEC